MRRVKRDRHSFFLPGDYGEIAAMLRVAEKSQIGLITLYGFVYALGTAVLHLQVSRGTFARKLVLQTTDFGQADRINGRDPNHSFRLGLDFIQFGNEGLLAPQHITAKVSVEFARAGETERAPGAIQQFDSKLPLEFLNALGGGGLADAVDLSGPAQTSRVRDVAKELAIDKDHRKAIVS
jgi:hypothetical protein